MLQLWKEKRHSNYPRYSQPNKTARHSIDCTSDSANLCWKNELEGFKHCMLNNHDILSLAEEVFRSLTFSRNPRNLISGIDVNIAFLDEVQKIKG